MASFVGAVEIQIQDLTLTAFSKQFDLNLTSKGILITVLLQLKFWCNMPK